MAVKSLLQSWFDLAVWHKPAILILDNLDRLFGAEVEVGFSTDTLCVAPLLFVSTARRFLSFPSTCRAFRLRLWVRASSWICCIGDLPKSIRSPLTYTYRACVLSANGHQTARQDR